MFNWNVFAPARPAAYAFAFALIGALAVVATAFEFLCRGKEGRAESPKKDAPKAPLPEGRRRSSSRAHRKRRN